MRYMRKKLFKLNKKEYTILIKKKLKKLKRKMFVHKLDHN